MKKILVVDDSALMRRVLCDIITSGKKYEVTDVANNGFIALELLEQKSYDAVVLDINMPKMTGVELLLVLRKRNIRDKILMASTDTKAGADITMECLELGALDFVHKPGSFLVAKGDEFQTDLLRALDSVVESRITTIQPNIPKKPIVDQKFFELVQKHSNKTNHQKVIAIASSTGGPRALQSVISQLPENLAAPVVIVQHMTAGFTKSFAERLNSMSRLQVSEAVEGEAVKVGHVYIAMGGKHLTILEKG